MIAEPTWQPADELVARREKLCDGPRCAVTFTPTHRGQRFCSPRCEAQAEAAAAVPDEIAQLHSADDDPLDPPARPGDGDETCAYEPCTVRFRPAAQGWQRRYHSWACVKAAQAEREPTAPPAEAELPRPAQAERRPDPPAPPPQHGDDLTDLRRRYFELLMDLAAKADSPSGELLDRIERTLEALA